MKRLIAVTGGTGFIGRRVVARLLDRGWRVRALARRSDPALAEAGAEVVRGTLEDPASLEALVDSARAVVHCAGAISARSRNAFVQVNRDGTAALAAALIAQPRPPRLILMSSLAAREPGLSPYAASKRMAEDAVREMLAGKADFCIVRPPAVYGPGDRATLPFFRQIQKGLLFVPAADARFSLLYVDDLAEIVARLLEGPRWEGAVMEPDDGSGGYRWADLARIAGGHLDRRIRTVPVPWIALWLPAACAQILGVALRRAPMLTLGKLRELYHSDWLCRAEGGVPLPAGPSRVTFDNGFAATLAWYMQRKWL
ncbi:MAG: NAD-dependent epimerase/dehydratase family protein [Geminicoccaceae bacterium]